jgi:DNA polymerase type B, organellar and viral
MKYLIKYGQLKPLIFKGKLISIKLKMKDGENKNKFKTIVFKDSYLLLPYSLRKLVKAFSLKTVKGFFPFNLFNIFYKGSFPDFKF